MFVVELVATHWRGALEEHRPWHVICPAIFGGVALLPGCTWAANLQLLTGVSIMTGLLFSVVVFLIQMRYQVRVGEIDAIREDRDKANLDYGFYSSCYAIAVGLLLIAFLLAQSLVEGSAFSGRQWVRFITNWIAFSLFTHFVMTMWVCLARIWRLYKVVGLNQS